MSIDLRRGLCVLAFLSAIPSAGQAKDQDLTPHPLYPPVISKSPEQLERERLARFDIKSAAELAVAGKTVRRVSFADIWDAPTTPAVVVERLVDSEVVLTVVSNLGRTVDRARLKPDAWAYITQGERKAFAPRSGPGRPKGEVCHGSSLVLESVEDGRTRRRDAEICAGATDIPTILYARRIAEVAVDAIPRCAGFREPGRESSWVLGECLKRTQYPGTGGYKDVTGDNNDPNDPFLAATGANEPSQGSASSFVISTSTNFVPRAATVPAATAAVP